MDDHGDNTTELDARRDALGQLVGVLTASTEWRAPDVDGRHLDAETIVGHLQRTLPGAERQHTISHLADCRLCRERVELAVDLLGVDTLETAPAANVPSRLDLGPCLLSIDAVLTGDSLRVQRTSGELRVGFGPRVRREQGPPGIAFRQTLTDGCTIDLELIDAGSSSDGSLPGDDHEHRVRGSLRLRPAPDRAAVSRIVDGRVVETRPIRRGQVFLRRIDARTTWLRVESPDGVMGHVRLRLAACSASQPTGDADGGAE